MIKVWVNHYGWIMGGDPDRGFRFTKAKDGAKPFEEFGKELLNVRICIERNMQCNYDLVRG